MTAATKGSALNLKEVSLVSREAVNFRLDAGKEITGTSINNFTLVSSSSTTATYTSQNNLPMLVTTAPNGTSSGQIRAAATTGPHGMLISGTVLYLPASHNVTFVPNGGALASAQKNSYDCRRRIWLREAEIQGVIIGDRATARVARLDQLAP